MKLRADTLPYRKPELGKHYWIKDNILPDPFPVVERCFNKTEWTMGSPWRPEPWPGMRAPDALLPEELAVVEDWVKPQIGDRKSTRLNSSHSQISYAVFCLKKK